MNFPAAITVLFVFLLGMAAGYQATIWVLGIVKRHNVILGFGVDDREDEEEDGFGNEGMTRVYFFYAFKGSLRGQNRKEPHIGRVFMVPEVAQRLAKIASNGEA